MITCEALEADTNSFVPYAAEGLFGEILAVCCRVSCQLLPTIMQTAGTNIGNVCIKYSRLWRHQIDHQRAPHHG